ncbi:MAG: BBP7 family outer membrane beta-barrel protein [Zavarzinella sp.]
MIRRKMLATMWGCLSLVPWVHAQTNHEYTVPARSASLGLPVTVLKPTETIRGQSPAPAYPIYVSPGYTPPIVVQQPTNFAALQQTGTQKPQFLPVTALSGPHQNTAQPMMGNPMLPQGSHLVPGMMPTAMPVVANQTSSTMLPPITVDAMPAVPAQPGTPTMAPVAEGVPMGTMMANPYSVSPEMDGILQGTMDTGCGDPCQPCCPLPRVWASAEYLYWRGTSAGIPPLVTQSPVATTIPGPTDPLSGALNDPLATTLFGGNNYLGGMRSGVRARAGFWFDPTNGWGVDLGYFWLGQAQERFVAESNGNPGLYRPFFNVANNEPDAQLVALIDPEFGPILAGRVTVDAMTDIYGFEGNLRKVLYCDECNRIDLLLGYRFLQLRDVLTVQEDLVVSAPLGVENPDGTVVPFGSQFTVFDRFETINRFHGGTLGLAGEFRRGIFSLGFRASASVGVTQHRVLIDGSTRATIPADPIAGTPGDSAVNPGGLLALPTNIGKYSGSSFTVLPEGSLTLGIHVTDNIRLFGGYNIMYWNNVARAGEQIDTRVNPNFLAGAGAVTGNNVPQFGQPNRFPAFNLQTSSYLLHGWTGGIEFRW